MTTTTKLAPCTRWTSDCQARPRHARAPSPPLVMPPQALVILRCDSSTLRARCRPATGAERADPAALPAIPLRCSAGEEHGAVPP
jgi:hypothetical protein